MNEVEKINHKFSDAARLGNLDKMKRLIQDSNVDPSFCNNLAFRQASRFGHVEVLEFLVALGIKITRAEYRYSACTNKPKVLEYLASIENNTKIISVEN